MNFEDNQFMIFPLYVFFIFIYIIFYRYCLTSHSLKAPNLDDSKLKSIKKKKIILEVILFVFSIAYSICLALFYYTFWAFIPIIILGCSIIFRLLKQIKLFNILFLIFIALSLLFNVFGPLLELNTLSHNCNIMSEVEISAFNSRFQQYEGENVTGAQVISLVQKVISNNSNPANEDRQVLITGDMINGSGTSFDTSTIKDNKKYKIEITGYYDSNSPYSGLVKEITITQQQ